MKSSGITSNHPLFATEKCCSTNARPDGIAWIRLALGAVCSSRAPLSTATRLVNVSPAKTPAVGLTTLNDQRVFVQVRLAEMKRRPERLLTNERPAVLIRRADEVEMPGSPRLTRRAPRAAATPAARPSPSRCADRQRETAARRASASHRAPSRRGPRRHTARGRSC